MAKLGLPDERRREGDHAGASPKNPPAESQEFPGSGWRRTHSRGIAHSVCAATLFGGALWAQARKVQSGALPAAPWWSPIAVDTVSRMVVLPRAG